MKHNELIDFILDNRHLSDRDLELGLTKILSFNAYGNYDHSSDSTNEAVGNVDMSDDRLDPIIDKLAKSTTISKSVEISEIEFTKRELAMMFIAAHHQVLNLRKQLKSNDTLGELLSHFK